jgi:hypothetical protein
MRVPFLQNAPQNSKGKKYSPITLKQGVCHTVALPFTFKKYLKAKEVLWKFKYFTMQKYIFKKIL